MYWAADGAPKPALISQAMGLYCAERCKGIFHNVFITFESQPHLVEIHDRHSKTSCVTSETHPGAEAPIWKRSST
jgi:hypothetical protein